MWGTTKWIFLLALAIPLGFPSSSRAFEFSPQVIDVSSGLIQSPVEISYTITNSTASEARYEARLVSLEFGESAEIRSIVPVERGYQESFDLAPQQSRSIQFTTPLSQDQGGYGIQITESNLSPGSTLSVRPSVLIPIFVVDGQATNLAIANVQMRTNQWYGTSNIVVSYSNQGQVTAQPTDAIIIKSLLGSVVEAIPLNPMLYRIPAGSARDLFATWDHGAFRIGIYRIELSTVRAEASESVRLGHVIILPWKLLAPVFVLLLVAYLIHARFSRKTKD